MKLSNSLLDYLNSVLDKQSFVEANTANMPESQIEEGWNAVLQAFVQRLLLNILDSLSNAKKAELTKGLALEKYEDLHKLFSRINQEIQNHPKDVDLIKLISVTAEEFIHDAQLIAKGGMNAQ